MINSTQIRDALNILDWKNKDLALKAKMHARSIGKIVRGQVKPHQRSLEKIQKVLEEAGVEFLDDSSIRKKSAEDKNSKTIRGSDIEVLYGDRFTLSRVAKEINKADGDIMSYSRGPYILNDVQIEYMTSIINFLNSKTYKYTRISIISFECIEPSYLWLLFMKKLLSIRRFRGRVLFKVAETETLPPVYAPIQSIGDSFVHYTVGGFLPYPGHIEDMFSLFIRGKNDCSYFINLIKFVVWNHRNSVSIGSGNIDQYIDRYKNKMMELHMEYAKLAEQYILDIFKKCGL